MKQKIILKSNEMFLKHGFKSVTMDDIANEMAISKKTIYQHFENKIDLIEATTQYLFETISCGVDEIYAMDKNPIEELFIIKDFVLNKLKDESTSAIYQLQKFYPQIHKKLMAGQFDKMGDCVIENLQKGIKQGLFRPQINSEIIARLYFAGMSNLKDAELFDPKKFSPTTVQETYLEYHLRSICTEKGLTILEHFLNPTQS
ncbi:TetR/AcrR family transcriptional regulator [Flavobacterium gilvum]|uniref:TetR family transcriptional regulator n=1 Tax=Flavobacterium gilvum TaxID=1492737 RepID=A0AAC9I6W1_9FLAO|nr:TetR/AcrR family transcriptional regulator [Flavobacterium gilvum]AOW09002.1 TetR family transcriptional regulator [Flavobacterium gilvum]